MIHESFYNVHITAQEQVPKPIDIDITEIININAYQSIIKFDIYDNNKDSSSNDPISFLPHHIRKVLSSPSSLDNNNNNSSNINSSIYHDVVVNDDDDDVDDDKNNHKSSSVWDLSTLHSGVTTKNSDDMFMLNKGNNKLSTDMQPLAKLLGDSYEDRYNNDKMKEKKNKIKKDKNHQNKYNNNNNNIHVNIIEMIPAGAMESNNNHNSSIINGNSKIKGNNNSSPHNKKKSSLVKSSSLSSSTKNNQISGEVSKLDHLLYV